MISSLYIRALSIAAACLALGALSYFFFAIPYFSYRADLHLAEANQIAIDSLQSLSEAGALMYGTISSIDEGHRELDVVAVNPFAQDAPPITFRVVVAAPAYIARQELIRQDGVVQGLTNATSSFSSLSSGDRVAFLPYRDDRGALSTRYVLFGDPL